MGNKSQKKEHDSNYKRVIASGFVVLVIVAVIFFIVKGGPNEGGQTALLNDSDLVISKSEITETASFYPYSTGGLDMEIIAVKASDGTIRTAFNTCQVCYDSGRGYYKLEGDVLICQNCGNRFSADQVELVKGGCNPVPIVKENKIASEATITITKDFLAENQVIFSNWSKV